MKPHHFAIMDLLLASHNDVWVTVPMSKNIDYASGRYVRLIPGRRAHLKHLNDLGLIQVRTVTIAGWHSPLSDPLTEGYSVVEVQAMLMPQGRDVALSRRADGTSLKGQA